MSDDGKDEDFFSRFEVSRERETGAAVQQIWEGNDLDTVRKSLVRTVGDSEQALKSAYDLVDGSDDPKAINALASLIRAHATLATATVESLRQPGGVAGEKDENKEGETDVEDADAEEVTPYDLQRRLRGG